jgi:hypothetical protein
MKCRDVLSKDHHMQRQRFGILLFATCLSVATAACGGSSPSTDPQALETTPVVPSEDSVASDTTQSRIEEVASIEPSAEGPASTTSSSDAGLNDPYAPGSFGTVRIANLAPLGDKSPIDVFWAAGDSLGPKLATVPFGEISEPLPIRMLKASTDDFPYLTLTTLDGATSGQSINGDKDKTSEGVVYWTESASGEVSIKNEDFPAPTSGSVSVLWIRGESGDDNFDPVVDLGVAGKCVTNDDVFTDTDRETTMFPAGTKIALYPLGKCDGTAVSESVPLPSGGRVLVLAYNPEEGKYALSVAPLK